MEEASNLVEAALHLVTRQRQALSVMADNGQRLWSPHVAATRGRPKWVPFVVLIVFVYIDQYLDYRNTNRPCVTLLFCSQFRNPWPVSLPYLDRIICSWNETCSSLSAAPSASVCLCVTLFFCPQLCYPWVYKFLIWTI
jgi:hypothetical protein